MLSYSQYSQTQYQIIVSLKMRQGQLTYTDSCLFNDEESQINVRGLNK